MVQTRQAGLAAAEVVPVDAQLPLDDAHAPQRDWDGLIRRHERRVFVTLIARGFGVELAREATQEAWLRLVERDRRGQLDRIELPGLAIRQALFIARDRVRRSTRRDTLAAVGVGTCPVPADPEDRMIARQHLRVAAAEVRRASPTARRVFTLLYGGRGMSAGDVAREVGISVQRVRQIACELRGRIRSVLGDDRG